MTNFFLYIGFALVWSLDWPYSSLQMSMIIPYISSTLSSLVLSVYTLWYNHTLLFNTKGLGSGKVAIISHLPSICYYIGVEDERDIRGIVIRHCWEYTDSLISKARDYADVINSLTED